MGGKLPHFILPMLRFCHSIRLEISADFVRCETAAENRVGQGFSVRNHQKQMRLAREEWTKEWTLKGGVDMPIWADVPHTDSRK